MVGVGYKVVSLPGQGTVRLDQQVSAEGALRVLRWLQHLEHGERGRTQVALRVGWDRPSSEPGDVDSNRIDPFRLARFHVIERDEAADRRDDVFPGPTAVEGVPPAVGQ